MEFASFNLFHSFYHVLVSGFSFLLLFSYLPFSTFLSFFFCLFVCLYTVCVITIPVTLSYQGLWRSKIFGQTVQRLLYVFFWVIPQRLNFICWRFGTLCLFYLHRQVGELLFTYLPMKMEQTECSETSEYEIQTPGNYPEENIRHTQHGESLKSSAQRFLVIPDRTDE